MDNILNSTKVANNYSILDKPMIMESLNILENAHHAMLLTIKRINEKEALKCQEILDVLQNELKLIGNEISRLHHLVRST